MDLKNELRRLREQDIKEEQDRKKRLEFIKKNQIVEKEQHDLNNVKNKVF